MKIIGRMILLLLVLLIPNALHAFKPNGKGHGGITREALPTIAVTINSETLKFTAAAIEEIKDANYNVDKSTDLFIRPTVGVVIDNTGSMAPVISGVRSAVASIVNSTIGMSDEPDRYLLAQFGDPDVGSPTIFTDPRSFLAAVDGIVPSGGGDCPELSMAGAYNAVNASDRGSRVFLYFPERKLLRV